jgi:hypothetical protein
MATSIQETIDRAMRSMGVIAAGKSAGGNDATDGLRALQDVINDLPLLMDGQWTDVFLTDASAYAASDGERIFTQSHNPTITLPAAYTNEYGATVATLDGSRVQIIGGAKAGVWVYAASLGAWAQVDALEVGDDSPFGKEDDSALAALVAVSLAGEYGVEGQLPSIVPLRAQRALSSFRARFYREVVTPCDQAFLRMSNPGNGEPIDALFGTP